MFVAIYAVIVTLAIGWIVGSLTSSLEWFFVAMAMTAFGIIIYRIEALRKVLTSKDEAAPIEKPAKEAEETPAEPVPEEESYGVNDLPEEE